MRERESKAVNANYFGNFYTSLLAPLEAKELIPPVSGLL